MMDPWRPPQLFAILWCLTAIGCSRYGGQEKSEGPAHQETASIKGTVRFDGVAAAKSVYDPRLGENVSLEDLVVNSNGTLRNVFVYIKDGLKQRKYLVPQEPVRMVGTRIHFVPRVVGLRAGQQRLIYRRAPDRPCGCFCTNENPYHVTNKIIPPGGEAEFVFSRAKVMIPVHSNMDPWRVAYIGVVDHPFCVTGEDGTFSLKDLPAGVYTVEAWHERLGTRRCQVRCEAGAKEIEFIFTMKQD